MTALKIKSRGAVNMKYDVFISYRRENGFLMAQVIYDRLEEKGLYCFLDLEELRSGIFDDYIRIAIQEAHSFILILSKNALDRCSKEDDKVRMEILEAVRCEKTIIPVMFDGFKWPKKWKDGIPEAIRNLDKINGVSGSKEYLPAMIDKIVDYMPPHEGIQITFTKKSKTLSIQTEDYFREMLERIDENVFIDMAFHAGADWRQSSTKVSLLNRILESGFKLRVLVNETEIISDLTKSMKQPLKKYRGYGECLEDWYELMTLYPAQVEVRVSTVPLFHRMYIIHGIFDGAINIKYYTYGNYIPDKDFRLNFEMGSQEYELYCGEFDYLWENSDVYKSKKCF